MRLERLLLTLALPLLGACSARDGSVYAVASGPRGRVRFPDAVANRGDVDVTLFDGGRCVGRYATVPGRVTMDDGESRAIYQELTQEGMAVLQCENRDLLRCQLSRDLSGAGVGRCTDKRGRQLLMSF